MTAIGGDDACKPYDSIIREVFKNSENAVDVLHEYDSFKKDVLENMRSMNDAEFKKYAEDVKASIKRKIVELSISNMPESHQRVDTGRFQVSVKKNFYFDFIKGSCGDWSKVDAYLSSYRNHQVTDLVKDGAIANLAEFDKQKQSKVCKEVKPVASLIDDFPDKVAQCTLRNLGKDNKSYVRVLDFTCIDHSPMNVIFITLFVSAYEKTAGTIQQATSMLVDLYNLSHHLSLKTEYFMVFSNLSKYFQQILIEVVTRRFDSDAGCQAFLIGALMHTLHDPKVFKAIKLLCCVLLHLLLEFSDPNALAKIFSLQADENPGEYRQVLQDFLDNIMLRDMITNENFLVYLPKIVKLMNALCFSLGSNSTCYILLADGTAGCLHSSVFSPQAQDTSYIMVCPSSFKALFAYTEDKIEVFRQADAVTGIEDFLSLSDKEGEDSSPHGKFRI